MVNEVNATPNIIKDLSVSIQPLVDKLNSKVNHNKHDKNINILIKILMIK